MACDLRKAPGRRNQTRSISSTFACFLSNVFNAACFFDSNMRVPAASSTMLRISGGFMLSTFVMRPCMIKKCGLFTLSWTDWKRFATDEAWAPLPLMR